ncbi:MAG: alanine racemase [Cyclobacteriaceae bacterium]|nr:alanine racemase [Cyclobacteriaceae bacterium]
MIRQKALFPMKAEFFHTTEDFLQNPDTERFRDETILIKGARSFGFERITNALSAKLHRTVLEINLNALNDNLNFYRQKIKPGVKLMVMVKASAYGSGSLEVAHLLQFNHVDYLTVAYPDEGVELRQQGIHIPMMVMNAVPESFEKITDHQLEPEIFSLNQLQALLRFLANTPAVVDIHLKLDSGMHRLGFEEQDLPELIRLLENNGQVQVKSIYSHLAGADEPSLDYFTHKQVGKFTVMADAIDAGLGYRPLRHILNSAGIYRFPQYQFGMVRLGIGLYGFEANQIAQNELRPISTLKTIVSQVRDVKAGETVGYGRKGKISRDSKIATIAIGYADGFSRAFGNGKISLFIHGKPAPVIGNVCMDMTMLDVTGMDVHEGDEVIVFGENSSIIDLANAIGTIPYEILTSISSRVSRVFYSG